MCWNRQIIQGKSRSKRIDARIVVGDILEILGIHCPLLEICHIEGSITHFTDIQIETFTKGCLDLKQVGLCMASLKSYHKLLHCLGSHNPALEKLYVGRDVDANNGTKTVLTREQRQSLQCLSNGCPLDV